jgi:hypothetical protein
MNFGLVESTLLRRIEGDLKGESISMPPQMNNPGQGGEFHGVSGAFYWWNSHGSGAPPHNTRSAYQWRVKVGSKQYGFDYYLGFPVAGAQLHDPSVNFANKPPSNGSTCWALVEWKPSSTSTTWSAGTPTSFTYYNA